MLYQIDNCCPTCHKLDGRSILFGSQYQVCDFCRNTPPCVVCRQPVEACYASVGNGRCEECNVAVWSRMAQFRRADIKF